MPKFSKLITNLVPEADDMASGLWTIGRSVGLVSGIEYGMQATQPGPTRWGEVIGFGVGGGLIDALTPAKMMPWIVGGEIALGAGMMFAEGAPMARQAKDAVRMGTMAGEIGRSQQKNTQAAFTMRQALERQARSNQTSLRSNLTNSAKLAHRKYAVGGMGGRSR